MQFGVLWYNRFMILIGSDHDNSSIFAYVVSESGMFPHLQHDTPKWRNICEISSLLVLDKHFMASKFHIVLNIMMYSSKGLPVVNINVSVLSMGTQVWKCPQYTALHYCLSPRHSHIMWYHHTFELAKEFGTQHDWKQGALDQKYSMYALPSLHSHRCRLLSNVCQS